VIPQNWVPYAKVPELIRIGQVLNSGALVALLHVLALGDSQLTAKLCDPNLTKAVRRCAESRPQSVALRETGHHSMALAWACASTKVAAGNQSQQSWPDARRGC
jgi:hypothetical protein